MAYRTRVCIVLAFPIRDTVQIALRNIDKCVADIISLPIRLLLSDMRRVDYLGRIRK